MLGTLRDVWVWLWADPMNGARMVVSGLAAVLGVAVSHLVSGGTVALTLNLAGAGAMLAGGVTWGLTSMMLLFVVQKFADMSKRIAARDAHDATVGRIAVLTDALAFYGIAPVWAADRSANYARDVVARWAPLPDDDARREKLPPTLADQEQP